MRIISRCTELGRTCQAVVLKTQGGEVWQAGPAAGDGACQEVVPQKERSQLREVGWVWHG